MVQFGPWTPGIAGGFVVRTGDKFVSGALNQELTGTLKSLHQRRRVRGGDEDVAASAGAVSGEPRLEGDERLDLSASAGQATRFGGRLFGGLGIPIPAPFKTAIVPAIGFTQEPPQVTNLGAILFPPGSGAHIPTTMDYAVRVTQKENPHFAFDIGIGHVAGVIGQYRGSDGLWRIRRSFWCRWI